jgi:hypothetical protein
VLLLNSRSGQEHDAPRHNYTSKYGKLVYSTHFPFNVLPAHASYAPDAMISLTRDGKTFGHRTHTRAGQAAPGFIWSKFDESLNDEPQPIWIGVLLWGDVQLRLTVIRPTFPVMAFEAPGALGCEQRSKVVRRSDEQAGWEYAEVDGHGVSIRRLTGYDCQKSSAPFLDQSNINLAYTYSEQPIIYESQASVAARCLAAASLVRPAPFNPAVEFAGITVETESPEIFRIRMPGQRMAFIAPGETTPKYATVNGIDIEGINMRYVQLTKDLNEICGLGLTQISGVATFFEPATFRLKRISNREVRVTTNTGISLTDQWLPAPPRRIEALTLDNQWLDVTTECPGSSIPNNVVQEWRERNQRILVDFWIHT